MQQRPEVRRVPAARKRKKKIRIKPQAYLVIILLVVIIVLIVKGCNALISKEDETSSSPASETITETAEPTPTPSPAPTPYEVDLMAGMKSSSAILIDTSTGNILNEKDSDRVIYPASLTKMMTALVIAENIDSLDKKLTITRDIGDKLYGTDASLGGFDINEEAPARDLLYGILLRSGAECCLCLANDVAGSEEAFVEMMNQKAEELGLTNTHFMNCTGLHDPNHYSSCRDLAIILEACMNNSTVKTMMMTEKYQVPPTNLHPEGFTMFNTLLSNIGSSGRSEDGSFKIEGGKTGYTSDAGQCLASFARIYDGEYVLVTVGAIGYPDYGDQFHIDDAILICNLKTYIDGHS